MSVPVLSQAKVREFDRRAIDDFAVPGVVLMENAGRNVAAVVERLYAETNQGETNRRASTRHVAICCGKGNNGGDGFVIARHLDLMGIPVALHCWQPLEEWDGDAGIHAAIVAHSQLSCHVHHESDWLTTFTAAIANAAVIVDALLGTGAAGDPRPPLNDAIAQMNAAPGIKVAVDVPSGLGGDDGRPGTPTFQADHTCTFVAAKPGLVLDSAKPYVGEIHLLDIGAPRALYESFGITQTRSHSR